MIVRFNSAKGYGFLEPDDLDEDIFFLRSEMPQEIQSAQSQQEVANKRVEFEVRTMPDGKLRAQRMTMMQDQPPPGNRKQRESAENLPPLDESLVDEMVDFLAESGGGADYGKFASRFSRVKKVQLEQHFDIFSMEKGQRIELPPGHPRRQDDGLDGAAGPEGDGRPEGDDAPAEDGIEGEDDVSPDEPAIPPGPGCEPYGAIKQYDPMKGYGFVGVEGFEEDIFFPRGALPESFQGKKKSQMPELVGVEVSVELGPDGDKGPRAQRLRLLLKWHAGDQCWLLRRR
uniref:CSD domain-containing protein n=1 Tax=Zooxanthella nutricula TaxID=1333877 RepID=A0A7S2MX99_9DINO